MSETDPVSRAVFDAKMETTNVKIDALNTMVETKHTALRDEIRAFKRAVVTALVVVGPLIIASVQIIITLVKG